MLNEDSPKPLAISSHSQWTVEKEFSTVIHSRHLNYRNLISMLLTYPDKAEEILTINRELVDVEFLEMMLQVANQMSQVGSQEAAALLRKHSKQLQQAIALKPVENQPLERKIDLKTNWQWKILLGLLFVLGTIGWSIYNNYFASQSSESNVNAGIVSESSPPVSTRVNALGRIQPKDKIISLSGASSLTNIRVGEILVKEGELVKQGQTIAILDNLNQLKAAVEEAKLNVEVARSRLEQVKAGASKQGEISAQKARIANLENQFQGETNTQKAIIARLEAQLNNAQTESSRFEYLYRQGAVSASGIDSRRLSVTTLQTEIDEARATLNQILATFPQRIAEAEATLNQLEEVRPTDVRVAETELEKALAVIPQAEAALELAYVRAPVEGQILRINTFAGESIGDRGVVDLAQTQEIYVVAEVHETDIQKIRQGQTATISSSALPKQLQGTVEQIGLQVGKKEVFNNDPTSDLDARVIEVKIRLEPMDIKQASKLINLQVDVKIDLQF